MNAAHVHLILNHSPLIGLLFSLLALLVGLVKRSRDLERFGLWIMVVSGALAVPTYLTGDPAMRVVARLPGVSTDAVVAHEDAAAWALIATSLLGLCAIGALIYFRGKPMPRPLTIASIATVLIAVALMGWTANLGGKIHHAELRGNNSETSETR